MPNLEKPMLRHFIFSILFCVARYLKQSIQIPAPVYIFIGLVDAVL